jgi:hypothetical protein
VNRIKWKCGRRGSNLREIHREDCFMDKGTKRGQAPLKQYKMLPLWAQADYRSEKLTWEGES